MPQLGWWLTYIEKFDYEVIHREGKKHAKLMASADSRIRPLTAPTLATNTVFVWALQSRSQSGTLESEKSVTETSDLAKAQQADPDFGNLLHL